MKYLKLYENYGLPWNGHGNVWKVYIPSIYSIFDSSISLKLDKIGMSKKTQLEFITHFKNAYIDPFYRDEKMKIYALISKNHIGRYSWQFILKGDDYIEFEIKRTMILNYEYNGEVLLNRAEKEECRIKDLAKKYNL